MKNLSEGIVESNGNGRTTWKSVAIFLGGIIIALCGSWASYVKGAVSRDEMERYVNERTTKIEERLKSLDDHVMQLKQDTSQIKGQLDQADRDRSIRRGQ